MDRPRLPTRAVASRPKLLTQVPVVVHNTPEALTTADLLLFEDSRSLLEKMNHKHHEVARLKSMGLKNIIIAQRVGMCAGTISNICHSPVFQELIEFYAAERDQGVRDLTARIEVEAGAALDALGRRIETEGDTMPIDELRKTTSSLLDRSGYSPVARSESKNLNLTMTARDLAEMKRLTLKDEDDRVRRAAAGGPLPTPQLTPAETS